MLDKPNSAKTTQAFVYAWVNTRTRKWYIGSRTAVGCHQEDGYICSSALVKPLIQNNPSDWTRKIVAVGEPREMREFESKILELFDASHDRRSLNLSNGRGSFGVTGLSINKGVKKSLETRLRMCKPKSEETRKKMSESAKQRPKEHYAKVSASLTGIKHTEDRVANITAAQLLRRARERDHANGLFQ